MPLYNKTFALGLVTGSIIGLLTCSGVAASEEGFLDWQSSDLSMKRVPADFNRFHHLVGTDAHTAEFGILCNPDKFWKGPSEFVPMRAGPYEDTVLEVQYSDNHTKVSRFRFVERNGTQIGEGRFSEWETEVIKPATMNHLSLRPNPLFLTPGNERFEKDKWVTGLSCGNRIKETWDLLHSYHLIGLNTDQITKLLGNSQLSTRIGERDQILSYQLTRRTDDGSSPMLCLELKISNNHVDSFRICGLLDGPGASLRLLTDN